MSEKSAMPLGATTDQPSSFWRAWSSVTMFKVGLLCRGFLLYLSTTEINGLESFMELLDSRSDPEKRTRGLITGAFVATGFTVAGHSSEETFFY